MSTTTFTSTVAFRASSALLRERSASGCTVACAEIERRAANGKGGYVRVCLRQGTKLTPTTSAAKSARARRTTFAPAMPDAARPASQRDTLKAVRAEFDARMTRLESTIGDVIAAVSKTHQTISVLSAHASGRIAA